MASLKLHYFVVFKKKYNGSDFTFLRTEPLKYFAIIFYNILILEIWEYSKFGRNYYGEELKSKEIKHFF